MVLKEFKSKALAEVLYGASQSECFFRFCAPLKSVPSVPCVCIKCALFRNDNEYDPFRTEEVGHDHV